MARPDPGLHNQGAWRGALRLVGPLVLAVGVGLTAVAMIGFFSAFGTFEMPRNFWMGFIGLPLIAIGAAMTKAAFLGPVTRYVAGEVTPTLRDTLGSLGISGGEQVCANCGGRSAPGAKFCDDCGTPLRIECLSCGSANASDARFCDSCGKVLPAS